MTPADKAPTPEPELRAALSAAVDRLEARQRAAIRAEVLTGMAAQLRRTPRDSRDYPAALVGARLIEAEVAAAGQAPAPQPDAERVLTVLDGTVTDHDEHSVIWWVVAPHDEDRAEVLMSRLTRALHACARYRAGLAEQSRVVTRLTDRPLDAMGYPDDQRRLLDQTAHAATPPTRGAAGRTPPTRRVTPPDGEQGGI